MNAAKDAIGSLFAVIWGVVVGAGYFLSQADGTVGGSDPARDPALAYLGGIYIVFLALFLLLTVAYFLAHRSSWRRATDSLSRQN